MFLDLAAAAAKSGGRTEALGILELAEKNFTLDPERMRRAALVDRNAGGFSRALSILKRLDPRGPEDADLLLELAAAAAESGRRPAALEALSLAENMRLDRRERGDWPEATALWANGEAPRGSCSACATTPGAGSTGGGGRGRGRPGFRLAARRAREN